MTGRECRQSATAGYKAMWSEEGLPPREYFEAAYPGFDSPGEKLGDTFVPLGTAGTLRPQVASRVGLPESVAVAVGNVDAWVSVPGVGVSGIRDVRRRDRDLDLRHDRPPRGDPAPRHHGRRQGRHPSRPVRIRGRAGSGRRHARLVRREDGGRPGSYAELEKAAAEIEPGATGLVALDWFNGNRTILADADLSGAIFGLTLQSTREQIYRALLESIAFGSRRIMDNFEEHGLALSEIVACGGIAERSPLMMQLLADTSGREVHVPEAAEIPARGAALFGAVAAGAFEDIEPRSPPRDPRSARTYTPDLSAKRTYDRVYEIYRTLYEMLGQTQVELLHELKRIRTTVETGVSELPRIGLLGIMQELYDDMLPGITERQGEYAAAVARQLAGVADVTFTRPARNREDVESVVRELCERGVDGIAIVMLTYGPAMRTVRALQEAPVPLLLANIQPERAVTAAWDMADLTYNQGIHGAQDQANALVRIGKPFSVITGDWRSDAFVGAFADWARAAQAVTALRQTRIALLGYPMNGMGDILYDPPALLRRIGPMIVSEDLGALIARVSDVGDADVDAVIARHAETFEVAADLPRSRHAYAARLEVAIRAMLEERDYRAFSFHFDSIGGDGRFEQLPLLAASDLMADGYGYAAEGDTNTASLMCAAQTMIGNAHFSEMYAMDWELESVLISHMGEGNWKIALGPPEPRLIDRELGIGRLDNPPTPVFSAEPGIATSAALVPLEGEFYRLVVGRGEVLDTPELPNVEMPYFHFRPESRHGVVHGRLAAARRSPSFRDQPRRPRRPLAPVRRAARFRLRGGLVGRSSTSGRWAARGRARGKP